MSEKELKASMNIALITLDSLRFDVAEIANTPNFDWLFESCGVPGWVKVGSHGTYTLPAHISIFHAGILPCMNTTDTPPIYNRKKQNLFKAQMVWNRNLDAMYPTPPAPNIVKGFSAMGYRTLGIGGVSWFNDRFLSSSIWKEQYFDEFYWQEDFSETEPDSFKNQIDLACNLLLETADMRPLFFFINVTSTHSPYRNGEKSIYGQAAALEYVDSQMLRLVDILPKPCHLLIMADHGECFGEDGLWGHGQYHPKVLEIPMVSLLLPKKFKLESIEETELLSKTSQKQTREVRKLTATVNRLQTELEQWQFDSKNLALGQPQSEEQKLRNWIEQLQLGKDWLENQLQEHHRWIEQLQMDKNWLESQWRQTQAELESDRTAIAAMESSKFWQLRTGWFRLKQIIGLTKES